MDQRTKKRARGRKKRVSKGFSRFWVSGLEGAKFKVLDFIISKQFSNGGYFKYNGYFKYIG